MMPPPVTEICVDTLEAAQTAARGGATRVEFCSALAEGGLTPSLGLVALARETVSVPIHVMVRPRAGNFVYSHDELSSMERDIDLFKDAGIDGVVLGLLTPAGTIDVGRTRQLVERARPMAVTFHRAFDECADLTRALEDVIVSGATALLTSGGAPSLALGATRVAELVRLAGGRLEMIGGAGVTIENAAGLWRSTGVAAMHASLRRAMSSLPPNRHVDAAAALPGGHVEAQPVLLEEDVRALVASFHGTPSGSRRKPVL